MGLSSLTEELTKTEIDLNLLGLALYNVNWRTNIMENLRDIKANLYLRVATITALGIMSLAIVGGTYLVWQTHGALAGIECGTITSLITAAFYSICKIREFL
jgi:hypothetical protein